MSAQAPGSFRSRAYQLQGQGVRLTNVLPIPFVEASLEIPDFETDSFDDFVRFAKRLLKIAETIGDEEDYEVDGNFIYYGSADPREIRKAAKAIGRVPVKGSGWEEIFRMAIYNEVAARPQQYGSVSADALFEAEVGNYNINSDAFARDESGNAAAPQLQVSGVEYDEETEVDGEVDESDD